MYKTETHLHTSEGSRCGKLTAADMVARYKADGFHTVFITDHFQKTHVDERGETWDERINSFLSGYRAAKTAGDEKGLVVLLGAEFGFVKHPNHYLVYGFDEPFLIEEGERALAMDPADFLSEARARGFLVVQAHPFRDGKCVPKPEWVDGFEVHNTNPRHENFDEKCEAVAAEYNLFRTGGSDAHRPEDVAGTGVVTETPIESVDAFIQAVRDGAAAPYMR